MSSAPLKIGIAGTGSIADAAHGPAVSESADSELVAVLSRSSDKGEAFLARHNGTADALSFDSVEEFASNPNLDLAIICTPDRLHFEHAYACLAAGKHVLLEKPLATTADQALTLVKLAAENNSVLATGFHLRSHAGHRELKQAIAGQDAIGQLRHIRIIWAWPNTDNQVWRAGSDLGKWWSLAAVGSHCIDLARWFANDHQDWKQFSATVATNLWGGPHDESAVVAAQLESGVTVEVVSSIQFGPYTRAEFFGSNGMAICDGTLGRAGEGEIVLNGQALPYEPANPFAAQLANIISVIRRPVFDPDLLAADGVAGLRSVEDLLLALDA